MFANENRSRREIVKLLGVTPLLTACSGVMVNSGSPLVKVHASDFGCIPGAPVQVIIDGVVQAIDFLNKNGGGCLAFEPGVYDLGESSGKGALIELANLTNILVDLTNAMFVVKTTYRATRAIDRASIFKLHNPNNVEFRGGKIVDRGGDIGLEWKGVQVFEVTSDIACSGFIIRNITAENVTCLVWAQSDENPYQYSGFDIEATLINCYYGVSTNRNGRFSRCRLRVLNVRRAFICYGCKDWDVVITAKSTAEGFGSNGLISLVCDGVAGNCSNVNIELAFSGQAKYTALVHFYHQASDALGEISNVYCKVKVAGLLENLSIFRFDHELPGPLFLEYTPRAFLNINLIALLMDSSVGHIVESVSESTDSRSNVKVTSSKPVSRSLPHYFEVMD